MGGLSSGRDVPSGVEISRPGVSAMQTAKLRLAFALSLLAVPTLTTGAARIARALGGDFFLMPCNFFLDAERLPSYVFGVIAKPYHAHLTWGTRHRGIRLCQLAALAPMRNSRLSRALNGEIDLTAHERARIAQILGLPEEWLFAEPKPPTVRTVEGVLTG
jgi:hypothetical protein